METLGETPEGWTQIGLPQPSERLQFRIAVTSPNNALLDQKLLDVSTPGHALYGQHMKRHELKAMLRPHSVATQQIMHWLQASGVRKGDILDDGEWINFLANTSIAERMMNTEFQFYRNEHSRAEIVRTLRYSVPEPLHQHIDMIQPTTRFGYPKPQRSTLFIQEVTKVAGEAINATCDVNVTPICLMELYNATLGYPKSLQSGNRFGLGGFEEEYARYNDFEQFAKEYAPYLRGKNFSYASINGGKDGQNSRDDSVEANLDVQYGFAMAPDVPGVYYSVGGRGPLVPDLDQPNPDQDDDEPWLAYLTYLKNLPDADLPTTLSNSYGEDEQSLPVDYTTRVCRELRDLGLRGVSLIFSSGDSGPGYGCQTNDGTNLTSVGSTRAVLPELAAEFSSGGFSDRFPRPSYQSSAVEPYLHRLGANFSGFYNPSGRAIPDVSAQGSNFRVINQHSETLVAGTSASAPTVAGLVARLNGARILSGQPPLGFLNPWIYDRGTAAGWTDITEGRSVGCKNPDTLSGKPVPAVAGAGWNATVGWDAVTGLGTPNFGVLVDSALRWSNRGNST
ncbi:MAG: vesicle formation at the endoplasmic reticulum [Bathelium mastoideum]|nr:MAG: vesicle formation at the endoplasmic reticulum [Bathelium mastoideum]